MESVIDTSILVDYIILESEFHERAKLGLDRITHGFLPSVVVEELIHVLNKLKLGKEIINEKIEEVLETYEVYSISSTNIKAASKVIIRESAITFKRFNDKLILSVAKEKSLPLFTFDQELAKECKANSVELFEHLLH